MKKYFFLVVIALTSVITLNAASMRIYCKMSQSWWTVDGAAVGCHSWGTGTGTNWPGVRMTPVDGVADTWYIDLDTDNVQNVIFTRVNPSDEGDLYWGAKTKDLVIPNDGRDLFTITNTEAVWGDPGCDGEWSVFGDNPGPGPQPTGDHTWYYKGYIDGQDVEPSESTMFTHGIAEFACVEKSYLMVIYQEPGKPGVQYMAETYVDGGDNCVLKNTTTVDKWGIEPYAGNLYLYEGDDATSVILSKVEIPGRKLVDSDMPQAINNVTADNVAVKFIENGEIRIRRGNQVYDVTGMQIR